LELMIRAEIRSVKSRSMPPSLLSSRFCHVDFEVVIHTRYAAKQENCMAGDRSEKIVRGVRNVFRPPPLAFGQTRDQRNGKTLCRPHHNTRQSLDPSLTWFQERLRPVRLYGRSRSLTISGIAGNNRQRGTQEDSRDSRRDIKYERKFQ